VSFVREAKSERETCHYTIDFQFFKSSSNNNNNDNNNNNHRNNKNKTNERTNFTENHQTTMKQVGLVALALIQLVDAISYMVVAPSIIFYVLQVGGTMDQYGLILSSFSFASFVGKPILGIWLDAGGNKFRMPYIVTISLAGVGGLCYFAASAFTSSSSSSSSSSPTVAIGLIFAGRFLGGLGAANQALGFAYLASVVPPDQQTQTNSLLSMMRILGMAVGPGFNVLLDKIHWSVPITSTFTLEITSLNSVGLFLAVANVLAGAIILIVLEEPPEPPKATTTTTTKNGAVVEEGEDSVLKTLKALCCLELMLPMYTLFVVNSGFQLYVVEKNKKRMNVHNHNVCRHVPKS
jgi:MFS family permease